MSIRNIQIESVLTEITNALFSSGTHPSLEQILGQMSKYFSEYPAGKTLPMPFDFILSNEKTDVEKLNLLFIHIAMNIDLAYQASTEQVAELTLLTQLLSSLIERLRKRQLALSTKIDDLMLSAYNTEGYYYSESDNFANTAKTDLTLTSAFVNTLSNYVEIPTLSTLSAVVNPSQIGTPKFNASIDGKSVTYKSLSPFGFSTNGLSNTIWEVQVETNTKSEVIFSVTLPALSKSNLVSLSEMDITPYGITPVQIYTEVGNTNPSTGIIEYTAFGASVQTGIGPMKFINGSAVNVDSIRLSFRKTDPDYTKTVSGTIIYTYIFGASDLVMTENVYDNQATWVTGPISISPELTGDMVIDAVSLNVNAQIPQDTNINYYVALDPGNATQLSDFNWQAIAPLNNQSLNINSVVQFNGATAKVVYIKDHPGPSDIQLIPINYTNTNLSQRNPSPTIIPAVDVYTLANFNDTPLLNSISLEEGVNSTRIYYTEYGTLSNYSVGTTNEDQVTANAKDMKAWANAISKFPIAQGINVSYGHLDTGNGFLYGGDIGENGVSVYVETYLYVSDPLQPVVDYLQKSDASSMTWDVRAYLNGNEVGWLPGRNSLQKANPIDSLLAPWNFNQGVNLISLLINIPPTASTPGLNPYIGVLKLMQNHNLYDFGTVKLNDWKYIDFFDLQYNTIGIPNTFTIYNGQIISRRQPTTNYRLSYKKANSAGSISGSEAIRVRADLSRDISNMNVTPQLNSYQLKFMYGN